MVPPGLHIMDMPSVRDWSETVTGLAAGGVHVVLALTSEGGGACKPVLATGHPDSPTLSIPVCVAIGP